MADLLDIGRTGLVAYRTALGVTGENIANVDTPGYRRREISQSEIGGAAGATNVNGRMPGGVEVIDIRRAFDNLLAERTRAGASGLGAAESFVAQVTALEDRLLPGGSGLNTLLDGFFKSLGSLGAAPADLGLRQVVLNAGGALASGVADMARGLDALGAQVAAEGAMAVDSANATLRSLAEVQYRMAQTTDVAARNPLLDQRDQLLQNLASQTEIHVSLDARQMATVRLGPDGGGPLLLAAGKAATLSLPNTTSGTLRPIDRVQVLTADAEPVVQTRRLSGGALKGLADAQGAVAQTLEDLGQWATTMARELNTVHQTGLSLEGKPGGALFSLEGWQVTTGGLTRGTTSIETFVSDPAALPEGDITLVYDGAQSLWVARDQAGSTLADGADALTLPGLRIMLSGQPQDGDEYLLQRRSGQAADMVFLPQSVEEIAAAAPLLASALPGNSGSAKIVAQTQTAPATGLPSLAQMLGNGPVEFVAPGVVGTVPPGASSVTLAVQGRDAAAEMILPQGATAQMLVVQTNSGSHSFALPAGMGLAEMAPALNSGQLVSSAGTTMADLGLYAETTQTSLTVLARPGTPLPTASLGTSAGPVAAQPVADAAPAAQLSVFTRDGRQLSGPPLSPDQAAQLLRPENGFTAEARYVTQYLNMPSGFGALSQQRVDFQGQFSTVLGMAGGLATWQGPVPAPASAAQDIRFDGAGQSLQTRLPAGASAAWAADILGQDFPVTAQAQTRVGLQPTLSGSVSFRLAGQNETPVLISADLGSGGLAALANALNAEAGRTGLRAEISPQNNSLHLVSDTGADIVFSAVSSPAGPLTLSRLSAEGTNLDTPVQLGGGAAADAARVTGTVALVAASPYAINADGTLQQAQPDPFANGPMTRDIGAAGSTQIVRFAPPAPGDTALRQLQLGPPNGPSITASADPLANPTAAGMATAMAQALRAQAPASRLEGAALPALPPDGAEMRVDLGAQSYMLRMQAGQLVVSGPEAGRLNAQFDSNNRLVIETNGGALDGAALSLPADAANAARFGMGQIHSPQTRILGAPFDASNLPASFSIRVGGVNYPVSVSSGAVVLPATFPGTGWVNTAYGRIEISFDARAGQLEIPAQAGAASAGLTTLDMQAEVQGDSLVLRSTTGAPPSIAAMPQASGTSLRLENLPDEELLVVLGGPGALRLSGQIDTTSPPQPTPPRELRILDAATGQVGLFDQASGAFLASRTLDAAGRATFGSLAITLSAGFATGDRFLVAPNTNGTNDARVAEALANLAQRDSTTGQGGYGAEFAQIQARAGAKVAAGQDRLQTAQALDDSARKAEARAGAVDLDVEAARLMQQQQAYQANAQVISVARQLFETLLNAV